MTACLLERQEEASIHWCREQASHCLRLSPKRRRAKAHSSYSTIETMACVERLKNILSYDSAGARLPLRCRRRYTNRALSEKGREGTYLAGWISLCSFHGVGATGRLTGAFLNTTRAGFATALDVSAYSLIAVTRAAVPLMTDGGAVVTLTYLGSERVVPHYNVMGVAKAALESTVRYLAHDLGPKNIRVNAVSAGPIKTLAARGVSGISKMVDHHKACAPLRRATEQGEVGDTALFLVSPLGRGITGEVIYVDGGYHILGSLDALE